MGTKNKLIDLNDHLFMQIERLGFEDLTTEELETEIKRAKAIEGIASKIIDNAQVVLNATKYATENSLKLDGSMPRILVGDKTVPRSE